MSENSSPDLSNAVAIIGMSGRFPGADNVQAFWENLQAGKETITVFTPAQLRAAGVPDEVLNHPDYVRSAGILPDIDQFDAEFFGMSAREAEITDPQHRIFLECAWEAFEDAGHVVNGSQDRISVYAGAGLNTYMIENLLPNEAKVRGMGMLPLVIGNKSDFLTSAVSYKLNLRGESINVNTACSTSLVAIHMACRSLTGYESDMALAGGVSIPAAQTRGYFYQPGGVSSPDGHCRAFDAQAQGTVISSGVAAVVLKRLSDAIADGDHIHAVIRATAVNNDGAGKVGFTAPGVAGQRDVIATALAMAEIPASTIGMVEAHGTGTMLGDPIEVRALTEAFRDSSDGTGFCALGSVKSNIGHLDTAAGVAGLIKATLCLRERTLVPSINHSHANPGMDIENTPFFVGTELRPWKAISPELPRRAAVSSFGIGGTNAHAILEEAPPRTVGPSRRRWHVLPQSTRTPSALSQATARLAHRLAQAPDLSLPDVAFTLQTGRQAFDHRHAVVASDVARAAAALVADQQPGQPPRTGTAQARKLVFMFPGIGDHYPGMGWNLYQEEPILREHLDRCAELLRPRLDIDIRDLLFPPSAREGQAQQPATEKGFFGALKQASVSTEQAALNRTEYLHPALFALEYALAQLWIDWLGKPAAMIGYSLGEYTAACVAGVMSLEDALMIVTERARLVQALPAGRMLAVAMPEAALRNGIPSGLAIAAINGPAMTVVAGTPDAIAALEQSLKAQGIACLPVQSTHAFHSPMMESMRAPLQSLLAGVTLRPPAIPYIANHRGDWVQAQEAISPEHWARHSIEAVRFTDGLGALQADSPCLLLEVGPGQTLCSLAQQWAAQGGHQQPHSLASLPPAHERADDTLTVARTLARMWCLGQPIDWGRYHAGETRQRVPLPAYPFERQRHWIDAPSRQGPAATPAAPDLSTAVALAHAVQANDATAEALEGDFEETVAALWYELLSADKLGPHHNFFALGGNSLLAVQFFTRLRAMYQIDLPLKTLFQAPTVRAIAAEIENALLAELEGLSDDEVHQRMADTPPRQEDTPTVDAKPYVLPNGMAIRHFNQVETDHFYHDIFEEKVYHSHGIALPDDAVIFDVGANIGLFSLYASQHCKRLSLYAFEPAPAVYALLQDNLRSNGVTAQLFNAGVADCTGTQRLTFYPNSTGMSSFHANRAEEKDVLHAIMQNQLQQGMDGMQEVMAFADQILEERFRGIEFECPMLTVSDVMRRQGLDRVDLLKIDVQKSEMEVLQGIETSHWQAIRQIVIEVHDLDGRVAQVEHMLRDRGYDVVVQQELLYSNSNISNLYAIRR